MKKRKVDEKRDVGEKEESKSKVAVKVFECVPPPPELRHPIEGTYLQVCT